MSYTSLLSHYRVVHRGDKSFSVPCFISGCLHTRNFNTEDALRKHFKKHHSLNGDRQPQEESDSNDEAPQSPDGRHYYQDVHEEAIDDGLNQPDLTFNVYAESVIFNIILLET